MSETTTPRLSDVVRELHELRTTLREHEEAAKKRTAELRREIAERERVLSLEENGIDREKVAIAETVLSVSDVRNGGREWRSCVADAMRQISTGMVESHYKDLWRVRFSTKNYDRWVGQRSDCKYGCGPRHGYIVFAVGLTNEARERGQEDLRPDEIEACVYYLVNIERIQAAARAGEDSDATS